MSLTEDFAEQSEQPRRYRPPFAVNFNPLAWRASATIKSEKFIANLIDVTGPYAYILNLPKAGECKPGYLSMQSIMDGNVKFYGSNVPETRDDLANRLRADGIQYMGNALIKHGHAMAFFLKPATEGSPAEILYLRRDSNKLWSYRHITDKGGCIKNDLPRNVDFSGQKIKSPLKADLGKYTQFLGFAVIPYDGLIYCPRITVPDVVMAPFFRAVPASETLGLDPYPYPLV